MGLLSPKRIMDGKADISWFVSRHSHTENNPFSGIGEKNRGRGISVGPAGKYLGYSFISL